MMHNIEDFTLMEYTNLYYDEKPQDYIDGEKGAWIMITDFIPVEIPILPHSIYYGILKTKEQKFSPKIEKEYELETDLGVTKFKQKVSEHKEYCYEITTEIGSVLIKQSEYSIVSNEQLHGYLQCVQDGSMNVKFYNSEVDIFNNSFKEALFYIQSRGISYADAILMLIDNIKSPTVLRFYPNPEFLKCIYDEDKIDELLQQEIEMGISNS